MRSPYADRPDASGQLNFSEEEMEAMLRESLQRGDQLMVHVAGDRPVETFLKAMDATGGEKVWAQRCVRFGQAMASCPTSFPRSNAWAWSKSKSNAALNWPQWRHTVSHRGPAIFGPG